MNENIKESFEPNEISISKIFSELWINKKLIITSVFLFSLASVIYSLSLTNLYTSNSTVSIATETEGRDISQVLRRLLTKAAEEEGFDRNAF